MDTLFDLLTEEPDNPIVQQRLNRRIAYEKGFFDAMHIARKILMDHVMNIPAAVDQCFKYQIGISAGQLGIHPAEPRCPHRYLEMVYAIYDMATWQCKIEPWR